MDNQPTVDQSSGAGSRPEQKLIPKTSPRQQSDQGFDPPDLSSSQTIPQTLVRGTHFALESCGPSASIDFPAEDGGQSLANMAERDLDATLQLLADRAQYITGSSGAAIALRRGEHNDMLCRASAGSNAPELGALLSTEFGLSGESVRTRMALRCDDAERDSRVNREGCRQLGISSVAVMPIVSDGVVLGVFELFSGRVNAFDERDLAALQRLSEMVETAVKLARAAEHLSADILVPVTPESDALADHFVFSQEIESPTGVAGESEHRETSPEVLSEAPKASPRDMAKDVPRVIEQVVQKNERMYAPAIPVAPASSPVIAGGTQPDSRMKELPVSESQAKATVPSIETSTPKNHSSKALLWSASDTGPVIEPRPADQSHIPPVLRNLRQCQSCGFPVSQGRTLCVECEEKKWRGQPRVASPPQETPIATRDPTKISLASPETGNFPMSGRSQAVSPETSALAADGLTGRVAMEGTSSLIDASPPTFSPMQEPSAAEPSFLSAASVPAASWISTNKYIVGGILAAAAAAAAIALLR